MYLTVYSNRKISRKAHQRNHEKIDGQIHTDRNLGNSVITQIQYNHQRRQYVIDGRSRFGNDQSAERYEAAQCQSH